MKDFVKRMVQEHSELVVRIQKLHEYIYSSKSDGDNKAEFANKCLQLKAMKCYEEALRARLENQGVFFSDGEYVERSATILNNGILHCFDEDTEPTAENKDENKKTVFKPLDEE